MPALATITVGVLSEKSGVDIKTIHAYQRLGLVPRPRRVAGHLLLYRIEDIGRLIFIRRALELGFSLDAVRELLGLARTKPKGCADIHEIAGRHLADLRRRIADLARMEEALAPLVESCPRQGGLAACPVINTLARPGPAQAQEAGPDAGEAARA
jgi:MerR family mercuric resistance operon transcriptional regulator